MAGTPTLPALSLEARSRSQRRRIPPACGWLGVDDGTRDSGRIASVQEKEAELRIQRTVLVGLLALLTAGAGARASTGPTGTRAEAWPAKQTPVTVVYDDVATEIAGARVDGSELWVTTGDLKRATRFELKPQGVCRDELCFPLPKGRKTEFLREDHAAKWFDLTAFARLVRQPVAREAGLSAWYFGLRADQRVGGAAQGSEQALVSLEAPNFTLPDMAGKTHSLADFRGRKVLLVTWASW